MGFNFVIQQNEIKLQHRKEKEQKARFLFPQFYSALLLANFLLQYGSYVDAAYDT